MQVYVNGASVPFRPFREDEYGPLMEHADDGIRRAFYMIECEPCKAFDDITCDPPEDVDQVWVRFPFFDWRGEVIRGNMKLWPEHR